MRLRLEQQRQRPALREGAIVEQSCESCEFLSIVEGFCSPLHSTRGNGPIPETSRTTMCTTTRTLQSGDAFNMGLDTPSVAWMDAHRR